MISILFTKTFFIANRYDLPDDEFDKVSKRECITRTVLRALDVLFACGCLGVGLFATFTNVIPYANYIAPILLTLAATEGGLLTSVCIRVFKKICCPQFGI